VLAIHRNVIGDTNGNGGPLKCASLENNSTKPQPICISVALIEMGRNLMCIPSKICHPTSRAYHLVKASCGSAEWSKSWQCVYTDNWDKPQTRHKRTIFTIMWLDCCAGNTAADSGDCRLLWRNSCIYSIVSYDVCIYLTWGVAIILIHSYIYACIHANV